MFRSRLPEPKGFSPYEIPTGISDPALRRMRVDVDGRLRNTVWELPVPVRGECVLNRYTGVKWFRSKSGL